MHRERESTSEHAMMPPVRHMPGNTLRPGKHFWNFHKSNRHEAPFTLQFFSVRKIRKRKKVFFFKCVSDLLAKLLKCAFQDSFFFFLARKLNLHAFVKVFCCLFVFSLSKMTIRPHKANVQIFQQLLHSCSPFWHDVLKWKFP